MHFDLDLDLVCSKCGQPKTHAMYCSSRACYNREKEIKELSHQLPSLPICITCGKSWRVDLTTKQRMPGCECGLPQWENIK